MTRIKFDFFCSPQIAMMTSVYSTIVMSFERYVRICHTCRLRSCKYITEENFKWVVGGKMGIFRLYVKSSSLGYSVSYQKSKRWLTFFVIQFIGGYIRPIQHILCPPAGLTISGPLSKGWQLWQEASKNNSAALKEKKISICKPSQRRLWFARAYIDSSILTIPKYGTLGVSISYPEPVFLLLSPQTRN